jgi:hypothetical protein
MNIVGGDKDPDCHIYCQECDVGKKVFWQLFAKSFRILLEIGQRTSLLPGSCFPKLSRYFEEGKWQTG